MELDNLKEAWRAHAGNSSPGSNEEIQMMLQKKSQSPIAKIKRNLRSEMIVVVVLYTACIAYYIISYKGRYWELALMLFLMGVMFMFYYYRKNKLLKEMECVTCEVKSNLERQVTTLEKYIRFYFVAGTLITPVAYFMTGIIVLYKSPGVSVSSTWFLAWFIGCGVAITILVYFLNIWYVNKLYGRHVKKLKELLRQMDETDA
jgi:hypothetical protein